MTGCLNGESEDLFFFLDGLLNVLLACSNERDVLRKECSLEGKHFDSPSVKHWFPSQNSRFNHRSGKHPWTLFWCSVTVLAKEYGRRYRPCMSVKILVFGTRKVLFLPQPKRSRWSWRRWRGCMETWRSS